MTKFVSNTMKKTITHQQKNQNDFTRFRWPQCCGFTPNFHGLSLDFKFQHFRNIRTLIINYFNGWKKCCQNVLLWNALMMHSAISSHKILFDNFRLELILVLSFKLSTYYTYLGAFEN